MGERQVQQGALFYEFSLERHVPTEHLLRSIDRFVELDGVRRELAPFYSEVGRPSIDPELMIRMLIVGYCFGIRSERRLCEEVHLNLAYRWFCRLGLDGAVPDHSTFSKNPHGRFRESDLLRKVLETTVQRCMAEGLVGGEAFAVDASMILGPQLLHDDLQRCYPGTEGVPVVVNGPGEEPDQDFGLFVCQFKVHTFPIVPFGNHYGPSYGHPHRSTRSLHSIWYCCGDGSVS
jgi:transposase